MNRTQAQARVEQVQAFRAELAQALEDGALALTPEQSASLTTYHDQLLAALARQYDVDSSREQGQLSLGMKVVSALGGLALCVALSLLVQRYWGRLDTPAQVTLLLIVPPPGPPWWNSRRGASATPTSPGSSRWWRLRPS
jgi:hypothetical protein